MSRKTRAGRKMSPAQERMMAEVSSTGYSESPATFDRASVRRKSAWVRTAESLHRLGFARLERKSATDYRLVPHA